MLPFQNQHFYKHDTWQTIQSLEGHRFLGQAASLIPTLVLASKADNTNKKYNAYFNKFILWCNLHNFPSLPADKGYRDIIYQLFGPTENSYFRFRFSFL